MCQCEFKNIVFNSKKQYLEFMKKQNERLQKKNGPVQSAKEFMADLEWIRKNRILYSYDGNFNNLRDI